MNVQRVCTAQSTTRKRSVLRAEKTKPAITLLKFLIRTVAGFGFNGTTPTTQITTGQLVLNLKGENYEYTEYQECNVK